MNMVIADFSFGQNEVNTKPVTQYDYGQTLQIKGLTLPSVCEIWFSVDSEDCENSIPEIGITKGSVTEVDIPDGFLKQDKTIIATIFIGNRETGRTIKKIRISIDPAVKPLVPHAPEDQLLFREVIEISNNAIASAEQAKENAIKTSADRAKVEELVKSVSGVDGQVAEMKALAKEVSDNAQKVAADKSEISQIKNEVVQAKNDVSTIKDNVSHSEEQIIGYKNEVVQIKTEVVSVQKNIEKIKSDIDTLNSGFASTVSKAISDIDNTKTSALSAIDKAKNDAIQSINTNTATVEEVKSYLQIQ